MPGTRFTLKFFAAFALLLLGNGCGYHLRGNTREFFNEHQIRTIYVTPVRNNSFKAGVEITVYNALRKRIAQGGYVQIVDRPDDADAQMTASVSEAYYAAVAATSASQLTPVGSGPPTIPIASIYEARLKVQFELHDRRDKGLWADELMRTKRFAASTYFNSAGSTSALINESEFERTLGDLSVSIVTDAEESINTLF